jgi:hypothetical protein
MRPTILQKIASQYPGLEPEDVILSLQCHHQSIYKIAKILGCSPSGAFRVLEKIKKDRQIKELEGKSK